MDCIMLVMGSCLTLAKSDFVMTCGFQQLCFFYCKNVDLLYKTESITILIIKSCILEPF